MRELAQPMIKNQYGQYLLRRLAAEFSGKGEMIKSLGLYLRIRVILSIKNMELIETCILVFVIVQPRIFGDERGYFFESFSQRDFERQVCKTVFVQDNESKSCYGVVRGLHFQKTSVCPIQTGAGGERSGTGCGGGYP